MQDELWQLQREIGGDVGSHTQGMAQKEGDHEPWQICGTAEVKTPFKYLTNGGCRWVKLTDEELQQRIQHNKAWQATWEQVYKGWKVSGRRGIESAETIEDEDCWNLVGKVIHRYCHLSELQVYWAIGMWIHVDTNLPP